MKQELQRHFAVGRPLEETIYRCSSGIQPKSVEGGRSRGPRGHGGPRWNAASGNRLPGGLTNSIPFSRQLGLGEWEAKAEELIRQQPRCHRPEDTTTAPEHHHVTEAVAHRCTAINLQSALSSYRGCILTRRCRTREVFSSSTSHVCVPFCCRDRMMLAHQGATASGRGSAQHPASSIEHC